MTAPGRERDLTPAQRLVWAGRELAPGSPLYNMGWRFEIDGALDEDLFGRAVAALAERHEALRTVFVTGADGPKSTMLDGPSGRHETADISAAEAADWCRDHARRPFDLARESFASVLLRHGPDRWSWMLVQHHLVTDAASGAVLFRDLSAIYAALRDGEVVEGQAPAFSSFAAEPAAGDAAWWSSEIADLPPPPRLFARPQGPTDAVQIRCATPLGERRAARLRALCLAEGFAALSPRQAMFDILATVLVAWIARVSGAERFAIGVATHGRVNLAARRAAGLFMEILPLGVDLPEGETFRGAHAQLRVSAMELLRRAGPGMVSAAGMARCNVVFNFIPEVFGDFAGLPARAEWLDPGAMDRGAALWVNVMDFAGSGAPEFGLGFNASVFDAARRDRASAQLLRLLDAMLDDPDGRIDRVPLAAADEASTRLCSEGFARATAEAAAMPARDVVEEIEARRREAPDAVALRGDGCGRDGAVTREVLGARSDAIAEALSARGAVPGALVGVHAGRSPDMIAAFHGILKAGLAYVPLDPGLPAGRLDAIEKASGLALVLSEAALDGRWTPAAPRLRMEDLPSRPTAFTPPPTDDGALAYVIFTSGSTGAPKGVEISRRALARYARVAAEEIGGGGPAAWPLNSSVGFDLTVKPIFAAQISGGETVIYREPAEGPDLSILRVFEDDAVDLVNLTPSHLRLALEQVRPLRRIRRLILGGEETTVPLVRRALAGLGGHLELFNEYGPTETTVGCMLHRIDPTADGEGDVPIGRAERGATAYVLDQGLSPAPDDVVGDLWIGGVDKLAVGYRGLPDETARAFVPDPFAPAAAPVHRMYRTGDLASVCVDGTIRFHGRADEQVKVRGVRVELAEVREAALAHPDVSDCATGVTEGDRGVEVALHYVADAALLAAELRTFMAGRLQREATPAYLCRVDRLPATQSGKLDRSALPDPRVAGAVPAAAGIAPRTSVEELLLAIWHKVLGRTDIGVTDGFLDIGGDSIAAVRIAAAAADAGLLVAGADVLRGGTIASLARSADRQDDARDRAAAPAATRRRLDDKASAHLAALFGPSGDG